MMTPTIDRRDSLRCHSAPSRLSRLPPLAQCIAFFLAFVASVPADADNQIRLAAEKIAVQVKKLGTDRVAVLPLLFVQDLRPRFSATSDQGDTSRVRLLRTDVQSMLYAEQMETYLAEQADGQFLVTPASALMDSIAGSGFSVADSAPNASSLKKLLGQEGTNLSAIVFGSITKGIDEHKKGSDYSDLTEVSWKLLRLDDNSILAAQVDQQTPTLAEAVYSGLNGEFFRWNGNRLRVLGDPFDKSKVPLNPTEDSRRFAWAYTHISPILNAACPYRVSFSVNGIDRPVTIPVPKAGSGRSFHSHKAFLGVEPGESLVIRVKNTTGKSARLVVFVDGVNVLEKKRELPNEACQAWVLKAGKTAAISGWYEESAEKVEPFVMKSWKDSVAGKLGVSLDADSARAITIVVLTDGPVSSDKLAFSPRNLSFYMTDWWDDRLRKYAVDEGYDGGEVGAPAGFGFGAGDAARWQPKRVPAGRPGVILAAMTVNYGPSSDIARQMKAKIENDRSAFFTEEYKLVEVLPPGTGRR